MQTRQPILLVSPFLLSKVSGHVGTYVRTDTHTHTDEIIDPARSIIERDHEIIEALRGRSSSALIS